MSGNQHMERRLKQIKIPEIHVHDEVMRRIHRMEPSRKINRRLMTAVTVLLFLLGTGFASVTFIHLYNDNGDRALSIQGFDDDHLQPVLTEEMSEAYLSLMMPGEAMAIYNPEGNPQNIVSVLEKPIEIVRFDLFREAARGTFPLPESMSGPFVFVKGAVHHRVDLPDASRLISESRKRHGAVVFEKANVTDEIFGVTLTISKNGDEYLASMSHGERWSRVYTDFGKAKHMKVIHALGSEGLLRFEEGKAIFMWRSDHGGKDVYYRITTNETSEEIEASILLLLEQLVND